MDIGVPRLESRSRFTAELGQVSGMKFGGTHRFLLHGSSAQDLSSQFKLTFSIHISLTNPSPCPPTRHFVLFRLKAGPCHLQPGAWRPAISPSSNKSILNKNKEIHILGSSGSQPPGHPGPWPVHLGIAQEPPAHRLCLPLLSAASSPGGSSLVPLSTSSSELDSLPLSSEHQ